MPMKVAMLPPSFRSTTATLVLRLNISREYSTYVTGARFANCVDTSHLTLPADAVTATSPAIIRALVWANLRVSS
jgi:hypothetical protein